MAKAKQRPIVYVADVADPGPAHAITPARLRADSAGLASAAQQPRLFALGADAYAVAARIRSGELASEPGFAGATGWLTKPFQPDQLLSVINRVLPA